MNIITADTDAGVLPVGADFEEMKDFVVFRSRTHRWAVEAHFVVAVRQEVFVTPLPGSERHVVGLVDLLGSIIPVFSLSELLGLHREAPHYGHCDLVIIGQQRAEFALQFTGEARFISVPDKLITYGAPDSFPEPSWMLGRLDDGTQILHGRTVLDDRSFTIAC